MHCFIWKSSVQENTKIKLSFESNHQYFSLGVSMIQSFPGELWFWCNTNNICAKIFIHNITKSNHILDPQEHNTHPTFHLSPKNGKKEITWFYEALHFNYIFQYFYNYFYNVHDFFLCFNYNF